MNEPLQLTPLERHYDDIQRFENRERYCIHSVTGQLPMRQPLTRGELYASQQGAPDDPVMCYADRRGV